MNIKRVDYDNQIRMAYERGLAKGKQEAREEALKEFKAQTFVRRVDCIEKAATSLLSVTEAAARIASAAENITRWPQ